MALILCLLLLVLLFGGLGIAVHALWIVAVIVLVVLIFSYVSGRRL